MGFRFYKRISIVPGISLNISKSGPSISLGPKGMKYTVGTKGTRTTFGIPGTGMYYTTSKSWKNKQSKLTSQPVSSTPGFFRQLFSSPQEKQFMKGLQAFASGNHTEASQAFAAVKTADGDFMCGFLALGREQYADAEDYLLRCKTNIHQLGKIIHKVQDNFELLLEITDNIEAPIQIDRRGLALALTEAYQHQNKYHKALSTLSEIWNENPSDKVVCLSLVDLVAMDDQATVSHLKEIIELTKTVENDEPIDTNILYLRSYALYRLNLVDAAIHQLTAITRKTKGRPDELMLDIRYLRGQMYEEVGQMAKARKDYEAIYAKNPGYQDVAQRLGL